MSNSSYMADRGRLKIAYIGSVPVESYVHGSALLYRLLRGYPPENLLIIECFCRSDPARRLDRVKYDVIRPSWLRLFQTRFAKYLWPLLNLGAQGHRRSIVRMLRDYDPQALLTIAVGPFFDIAASCAIEMKLPLHVIVHDDWPNDPTMGYVQQWWSHRTLKNRYPSATSRLCISSYMAEEYERRYGGEGGVLYPSRSPDAPAFDTPPGKLAQEGQRFTVAFCGTIYLEYARAIQRLAIALRGLNGRVLVFGPKPYKAGDVFLSEPNIELRGTLGTLDLIHTCREEAHAIFVPMSYRDEDRHNMQISFPSKLADCTAMGLPLIIDGPVYCSAVRWALQHPGVAQVVATENIRDLEGALRELLEPCRRVQLATTAIRVGREYFDHTRAFSTLLEHLAK